MAMVVHENIYATTENADILKKTDRWNLYTFNVYSRRVDGNIFKTKSFQRC